MSNHHIHVELSPTGDGPCVIQVDGTDLAGAVRSIEITAGVGQLTEVHLELVATPLTFEGQARLWLPSRVVDLLAEYGWTPPEHAEWGMGGVRLARPDEEAVERLVDELIAEAKAEDGTA